MAKLEESQLKKKIERDNKKRQELAHKMEIMRKKELYGENWRQIEAEQKKAKQQELKDELDIVVGDSSTPKIFDVKDVYEYFQPISLFKDSNGKLLKADFQDFEKFEEQYVDALKEIDKKLKEYSEGKLDDANWLDGKEIKELVDDENASLLTKQKVKVVQSQNKMVARYFGRFVPLYDRHICTCCGKPKRVVYFPKVFSPDYSDRLDKNGNFHSNLCLDCCDKLFGYLFYEKANSDLEKALRYFCASLNIYWSQELYYQSRITFEKEEKKRSMLSIYLKLLEDKEDAIGKTFIDSLEEMKMNDQGLQIQHIEQVTPQDDMNPDVWSKEDLKNKKTVLHMIGYNPFDYESDENQKILFKDLLNIIEPGMESDLVKTQAAIQIVISFFKIREMNKKQYELENSPDTPMAELKAMSELKAKELKTISEFSRDNGFSERYATAKAKGENTFTGILNKMNESKFEKSIVNKYDIETSETIQQAADASIKAIMGQLSMSESEVFKLTQDQYLELVKLRRENAELQEEVRIAKTEVARVALEQKAMQAKKEEDEW